VRAITLSASGKHSGISGGAEFVPDVRRKRSSAFGTFVSDLSPARVQKPIYPPKYFKLFTTSTVLRHAGSSVGLILDLFVGFILTYKNLEQQESGSQTLASPVCF